MAAIQRRKAAGNKAKGADVKATTGSKKAALDQYRDSINRSCHVSKEDIQKYLRRFDKMDRVLNRRKLSEKNENRQE